MLRGFVMKMSSSGVYLLYKLRLPWQNATVCLYSRKHLDKLILWHFEATANGNCIESSCASKYLLCTVAFCHGSLFVEQWNSLWPLYPTNPQQPALFRQHLTLPVVKILSRILAAFKCLDWMVWLRFCGYFSHMGNVVTILSASPWGDVLNWYMGAVQDIGDT